MFAVLHIADFPLHAVLRLEPDAAQKPAALFTTSSKKSVVLSLNTLARAAGVELGMTAPQAVARCPALLIRTPQPAAEADARAALLTAGHTLSPNIEDTAPGICTADISGLAPTQHKSSARQALRQLAHLGLPATAGLAPTPLLALYAARATFPRALSRNRSLSPSSNSSRTKNENEERERFDSSILLVTAPASFLAPLPLSAADPSPELADVFNSWGLRTLGDLTALPRDEIVRRFGTEGLTFYQRASGGSPRPLHLVAPAQTFTAALELENEIETLEPLLFLLRRFLDRLTLELRASQHVAAELHLTLKLEDDTQHARDFRLPEPTADADILFRTLHTHLESLQTAASICAIELRLTPARPLVRQQGLFDTGLRDPHGFAETLARIGALVGDDRIGTPRLQDTHRPDSARLVPPLPVIPPAAEPPLHPPLGAPLRRFRPPLPARLEFTDGRPTYLWTEYISGEIAFRSPAYPSSGEWWQPDRAWSRTEWDIALAPGGLYRLLHIHNAYFLEGEYD
jgi:Nucleotidyltransferase/DNA polymerase involved in DNA repair